MMSELLGFLGNPIAVGDTVMWSKCWRPFNAVVFVAKGGTGEWA